PASVGWLWTPAPAAAKAKADASSTTPTIYFRGTRPAELQPWRKARAPGEPLAHGLARRRALGAAGRARGRRLRGARCSLGVSRGRRAADGRLDARHHFVLRRPWPPREDRRRDAAAHTRAALPALVPRHLAQDAPEG